MGAGMGANISNEYAFYLIGHNRYSYNGREGFYLNCVSDYEAGDKDQIGAVQTAVAAPYEQSVKLAGIPMGLFNPAIIKFKGRLASRGGNSVLVADEIISITPYEQWALKNAATTQKTDVK